MLADRHSVRALAGFARCVPHCSRPPMLSTALAVCSLLGLGILSSFAQEAAPATLHVYTNLIQVPVLVLSKYQERLPPLDLNRFGLNLNGGKVFAPSHVRMEGDDPITLSILVDLDGPQQLAFHNLAAAVGALSPALLRPQDRFLVYTVHCDVTSTRAQFPAGAEQLRQAVEETLAAKINLVSSRDRKNCGQPVHLWDSLSYVARNSSMYPGRPVVLVVSNGEDRGSSNTAAMIRRFANDKSVAIFALTTARPHFFGESPYEWQLDQLCQLTGGMLFESSADKLQDALAHFLTLVRERYIIYFSRPNRLLAGPVELQVFAPSKGAFVRAAGISVPLADKKLLKDPNAVVFDPLHQQDLSPGAVH